MVRPKGKVVERKFRVTVSNGILKGKKLYCRDVIGATISFDKFKQMVKSKLRSMGLSAEISVEIFWGNDWIECELDFFEMWRYAVEDKYGFVTLHVDIIGGGVDMDGSNGVDMASSSGLDIGGGDGVDMAVGIRGNINVLRHPISIENLDDGVLENILFRLPLGTVSSQAKRVCKLWKSILSNRRHNEVGFLFACRDYKADYKDNKIQLYFGEEYDRIDIGNKNMMNYYYSHETLMEMEHGRFAYEYYDDDILVGSCNGLVCFQKEDPGFCVHEPFAICNPLTGEFIFLKANLRRVSDAKLVIAGFGVWGEPYRVASGFGYCKSTNKYKVVRLYTLDRQQSNVQIYTIGSNEWKDMKTVIHGTFCSSGIFANGVLHWLNGDKVGSRITTFDLEDEMFEKLPLPPIEALEPGNSELKLLGGNLCWVQEDGMRVDIWAYKRNNLNTSNNSKYGMEEHDQKRDYYRGNFWNWVKEFSIEKKSWNWEFSTECGLKPFAITKSNEVLLLRNNNFYYYDPNTGTRHKLVHLNGVENCSCIQAIPHANSYVSLKDFGETWYGPGCSAVPQTNSSVFLTES